MVVRSTICPTRSHPSVHAMKRSIFLSFCILCLCLQMASAVTPPGIVFEAEAISEPAGAWLRDRTTADHWNLWTKEAQIEKKRSGGAVLASPPVKTDRATPEEAPPRCIAWSAA